MYRSHASLSKVYTKLGENLEEKKKVENEVEKGSDKVDRHHVK